MACVFLLLVLVLCSSSVSALLLASISCGSLNSYTDDNDIVWTSDFQQRNGIPRSVPTNRLIPRIMDTLRVFTTRKKNCYSLAVNETERLLVRASFYYGNYDGKSLPPAFDLQFDGNVWDRVKTSMSEVVSKEVIYVAKGDSISICVAQIFPGQYPIISALEVRNFDLDDSVYSYIDKSIPLFLLTRNAYGTKETIRYDKDDYDRIWEPVLSGKSVENDYYADTDTAQDKPPEDVFENAITTSSTSIPLILPIPSMPHDTNVQINLYFTEVISLDSDEWRSFKLHLDNDIITDSIVPIYGEALEVNVNKIVSNSTVFSLVSTSNSTLPPLISALEVFRIGDKLTDGTNSSDVEGLAVLQHSFLHLQDVSGDPCLPASYTWDWVNCSSNTVPRVTALNLGSFGLLGTLPDFSSMEALETIDLHNNSISGNIPDFLGELPKLKVLNLANNLFTVPIPVSLLNKKGLNLILTGNPALCPTGKSCQQGEGEAATSSSSKKTEKSSNLPLILGISIPSFFVMWVGVFIFVISCNKRNKLIAGATNGSDQAGGDIRPSRTPQEEAVLKPQIIG